MRKANFLTLRFTLVFWAYNGISSDLFYRLLGVIFGKKPSAGVVALKVLADQFLYTPFWSIPLSVLAFQWYSGKFRTGGWPWRNFGAWYGKNVPSSLVTCWGYWIPMCAIFYSLPGDLQMPVATLMNCFWALLFTYINAKKPAAPVPEPHQGHASV